jgi:nucleoside-diphosphate-sugar epimerase
MTFRHGLAEETSPSRVVVLGAHGFLGARAVTAFKARGVPVAALASRDVDLAGEAAAAQLRDRLAAGDTVVFLSALTPDKGRDSATFVRNLQMARAVAAAASAASVSHLVYASSDAVYSFASALISEQTPAAPGDLYGAMHRARELILAAEAGTATAVLRFTALYGTGDTHNSYGPNRFTRQAAGDGRIVLGGEGEETRDHLFVDDAVEVLVRVVLRRSAGLLNVASGTSVAFRELADAIAAARPGVSVTGTPRQSPITHRHFDPTMMALAFPDMRFTQLAAGLARLAQG